MALFTYFDCESDAGAAQKATCLSVAAVTVDEKFKIVDQWKINSRFRASRAFEVDAMLAHNIPVEVIENEKLSNPSKCIQIANALPTISSSSIKPIYRLSLL